MTVEYSNTMATGSSYHFGFFNLNRKGLTTLENQCPSYVTWSFYCSVNPITSLVGCPDIVDEDCIAKGTKIVSLQGIGNKYLKSVGGILDLRENKM